MKVTALKNGYFNGRIIRQGEQFEFTGEPSALGSWMGGEEAENLRAKNAKADAKAPAKDSGDAKAAAAALKEAEAVKADAEKAAAKKAAAKAAQ